MSSAHPPSALWLYIELPRIAVEVLLSSAQRGLAAVAVSGAQSPRIRACSAAAEQLGAAVGQSLSSALSLAADLLSLTHCNDHCSARLTALAHACYRFSPELYLDDERGIWLEISASRQLYRGYPTLLEQLDAALRDVTASVDGHPLSVRGALAATPLAAQLCARQQPLGESLAVAEQLSQRAQQQTLEALPIAALPLPQRHRQQLAELGICDYAALRKLDSHALGARFGEPLVALIERLESSQLPPLELVRFRPAEQFASDWQHSEAIISKTGLAFPIKRLLLELQHYLLARQLNALVLHWQFSNLYNEQCVLEVRLSAGDYRWPVLLRLSQLQLDCATLPAQIEKVALRCSQFSAQSNGQADLFGAANSCDGDSLPRRQMLLDLYYNRLGNTALHYLTSADETLPEWRSRLSHRPIGNRLTALSRQPRPLWLLSPALPANRPPRLRFQNNLLQLLDGTERISEAWWRSDSQENPQAGAYRDYFVAADALGNHYWLYCRSTDKSWFVHGLFG